MQFPAVTHYINCSLSFRLLFQTNRSAQGGLRDPDITQDINKPRTHVANFTDTPEIDRQTDRHTHTHKREPFLVTLPANMVIHVAPSHFITYPLTIVVFYSTMHDLLVV